MKKFITILLSLILLNEVTAFAGLPQLVKTEKIFKEDGSWSEKGKYLLQEYASDGALIKESIDSNGDGNYDQWVTFRPNGEIVKEFDLNFDSIIDRRDTNITNDNSPNRLFLVFHLKGKNFEYTGAYREASREKNTEQNSSNCVHELNVEQFSKYKEIENIVYALKTSFEATDPKSDLVLTDLGFAVSKSCIKKFGKENLYKNLRATVLDGTACMLKNSEGPLVDSTLQRLSALLGNKKNPIKILCEQNGCWDTAVAYGSLPGGADHPYISLSPYSTDLKKDANYFKSTIFHELMHNCGFRHNHSVDLSYMCDSCCFESKNEKNNPACKICGGKYTSVGDPEYLKELSSWAGQPNSGLYASWISTSAAITQYMISDDKNENMRIAVLQSLATQKNSSVAYWLYQYPAFESHTIALNSWNKIQAQFKNQSNPEHKERDKAIAKALYDLMQSDSVTAAKSFLAIPEKAKKDEFPDFLKGKLLEKMDGERELHTNINSDVNSRRLAHEIEAFRGKIDPPKKSSNAADNSCDYPWPPKPKAKNAK